MKAKVLYYQNHKLINNAHYFLLIRIFLCFTIIKNAFNLSNEAKLIKLDFDNEIIIMVNGTGTQKILSDSVVTRILVNTYTFNYIPNSIYINGILQSYTGKTVQNLEKEINIIKMVWNQKLDKLVSFSLLLIKKNRKAQKK